MSLKQAAFATLCPAPKTLDRFEVWIPGILTSPLRVQSAGFPQPVKQSSSIMVAGLPYFFPTKTRYSNTWTCILTEDAAHSVLAQIEVLRMLQYGRGEVSSTTRYIEPKIFLTDQFTGILPNYWVSLNNCYLESVDELKLDWSSPDQPLQWRLTFKYSSIKPFPLM